MRCSPGLVTNCISWRILFDLRIPKLRLRLSEQSDVPQRHKPQRSLADHASRLSSRRGDDNLSVDPLWTHSSVLTAQRMRSDGFLRSCFVAVAVYPGIFMAVTRVRIPSGTPTK
jgi:hypothetical protein